ncbi:glycosyltransferase family 4 protein [Oenococcus sp.]|uniref:glycosyltransferase family 4 protein n=1 Tax=Oenococcus sp. TaxID=1979414 RepID=UPI0039E8C346
MKNIFYLHASAELYGSDKVLLNLVTGLDKKQFRPIVILPEAGPLLDTLKASGIIVEVVAYPILRRKYFNPKGIFNYVRHYTASVTALAKLAKKYEADLIHVNTLAVLEGILLKRRIHKPLVWHVHEIIEQPKFLWRLTAFLSARYADKIIAVSQAVKDNLTKAGYSKTGQIAVVYNGILIPDLRQKSDFRSSLQIPEDAFVFGHIGRINAWKGQMDFLQAAAVLMPKFPKMQIIFSGSAFRGEAWREAELKKAINQFPFRDKIHYLGFQQNVAKVYRTIDAFVSTSNRREAFSLVAAEAMSWSKPVIAYDVSGPKEIIDDQNAGILVPLGNIAAVSAAMMGLIEDRLSAEKMGKAARKRIADNFGIETFCQKISDIYMDVLANE